MKKDYIHLCIDDELKQELEKEAKALRLTLNGYIRMILTKRKGN